MPAILPGVMPSSPGDDTGAGDTAGGDFATQIRKARARYHPYVASKKKRLLAKKGRTGKSRNRADKQARCSDVFGIYFEHSTDVVGIIERDGRIRSVNSRVGKVLGSPPAFFEGKRFLDIVHPEDVRKVAGDFDGLIRLGNIRMDGTCRLKHSDGTWSPFSVICVNLLEDPEVNGIVFRARDLSDPQVANLALEETHEWLNAVIEASPLAITLVDLGGKLLLWNRAAEEMFGWKSAEVLGQVPPFIPSGKEADYERVRTSPLSGKKVRGERVNRVRKNGSEITVSISVAAFHDNNGNVVATMAVMSDVTGHVTAEKSLIESESRYRTIVENLQGIAYRLNSNMTPVYYHGDSGMVCGYTPEDLIAGKPDWVDLVMEGDLAVYLASMDQAKASPGQQVHLNYWIKACDGSIRYIYHLMRFNPGSGDGKPYFDGFIYNTTDAKNKEIQLSEVAQEYDATFNALLDGIFIADLDCKVLRCNEAFCRLLEKNREEIIGRNVRDLIYLTGCSNDDDPIARVKASLKRESKVISRNGRYFGLRVDPFLDASGTLVGSVNVISDITERIKAEEKLHQINETLGAIIKGSPLAIITFDPEGRVLSWNHAAETIYGWSEAEALGKNLPELPESEKERSAARWSEALAGNPRSYFNTARIRKDGVAVSIISSHALMRDRQGAVSGILAMSIDNTEQVQMEIMVRQHEEEVRQLQKMEAIGRLAGGMAHDFNNILTAILGYGDLLLGKLPADSPLRRNAQEIVRAAERATELSGHLLTFSRKKMFRSETVDINGMLDDISPMISQIAGVNVSVKISKGKEIGNVAGSSGLIQQVLMNLAINGCEAMPAGGLLVIETFSMEMDGDYALRHPDSSPGKYAVLSVSDTGMGMDKDVQAHLFEPFFTTKEAGNGLGLSTAYGIVSQMNGHFSVYSEPGKGTTFKIYFPLCVDAKKVVADRPSLAANISVKRGAETILIVDDQENIRTMACLTLTEQGYKVLEAPDGFAALELGEKHAGTIDMLLTDLVMPGMSGQDLAKKFSSVRGNTRILLMSGYTDTVLSAQNAIEQGAAFLQKPFTASTLILKVREVLDGENGR